MSQSLPSTSIQVPILTKLVVQTVVKVSTVACKQKPKRLKKFLEFASRGARDGTYAEVSRARDEVLAVSTAARGSSGCLIRSTSVSLLCRLRGHWPAWCVGVMAEPPFMAHAWVEVDGQIVDEPMERHEFRELLRVAR